MNNFCANACGKCYSVHLHSNLRAVRKPKRILHKDVYKNRVTDEVKGLIRVRDAFHRTCITKVTRIGIDN